MKEGFKESLIGKLGKMCSIGGLVVANASRNRTN